MEYRRDILRQLIARYDGRKRVRIEADEESLSRLADPGLANDVSAIIRNKSVSVDLRIEMLRLVQHGRLIACLESGLELIADGDEPNELKVYAAAAVRDAGGALHRQRLALIAKGLSKIPTSLCARLCEALYPDALDAEGFADILRKANEVPRYSVDLPWYLERHLESVLHPDKSALLLAQLVKLGQTPPFITSDGKPTPVSNHFYWVGMVIPVVLMKLFEKESLNCDEIKTASEAIWLLSKLAEYGDLHGELSEGLCLATEKHPQVRKRYLWRLIEEWRERHSEDPLHIYQLFDYYEVIKTTPADLKWMVNEIHSKSDRRDRELMLRLTMNLWNDSAQKWRDHRSIRKAVGQDASLSRLHRQLTSDWVWLAARRIWHQRVKKFMQRWWWQQRFHKWGRLYGWVRDQSFLLRKLREIGSGENIRLLSLLVGEAAEKEDHDHWAPRGWEGLRKKRGRLIAQAAKEGSKLAWRTFVPLLPHEKLEHLQTNGRVIIGLAGLQARFVDKDLDFFRLDSDDARLAARYAINELNGFAPWLPELAKQQPDAVRDVLVECIRGEWQFDANRKHPHEVLHDLAWHGEGVAHLVTDRLLAELKSRDPDNAAILEHALAILFRAPKSAITQLAEIAQERIKTYSQEDKRFNLWLAAWLQLAAVPALEFLKTVLQHSSQPDGIVVTLCSSLSGERRHRSPLVVNPDYAKPDALRQFIPLAYKHINQKTDIDRTTGGPYSPTDRDDAQRFRNALLDQLANHESPDADKVLRELLDEPLMSDVRDWILNLIDSRTSRRAELPPWSPADIRTFATEYEVDPKTDYDLFKIALRRLEDIKHDVEKAENSLREELNAEDAEPLLRRWLQRKLFERSRNRYNIPQEAEIDLAQRPDLRFENPTTDSVSLEIKRADCWTIAKLFEGLERQLVGQYLRAHNARYGIYLLATAGRKGYWEHQSERFDFERVLQLLRERAKAIVAEREDVSGLEVVGIDFTDPRKSVVASAVL